MTRNTISAGLLALCALLLPPISQADVTPYLQSQVPTLAPMLQKVLPAVVNIRSQGHVQVENPLLNDPFFRYFFNVPPGGPQQSEEFTSIGSGVIVDADKGYILTNNHVIENSDKIKVALRDDRELDAKVIGRDPDSDIAVLQVKADHLNALPIGDSDALQVGDFVVAIGNPFGIGQTVTSGIVSALGRTGLGNRYENFIQTDASINPGNSGGALVNLKGELVGINSQIISRTGTSIGIGFAIPSSLARNVMDQIVKYGKVERGRIGVSIQPLTPALAKAFGLSRTHGAIVTEVEKGSPADKAGIKAEDVIIAANGKDVEDASALVNAIGLLRVGQKVELTVLRDGKPKTFTVTVGKQTQTAAATGELNPRLEGAKFGPLDDSHPLAGQVKGVVVKSVEPGSPAADAGLQPGDVIVSVNRKPVENLDEFTKLAGPKSGDLLLNIRRGNGALFVLIQ